MSVSKRGISCIVILLGYQTQEKLGYIWYNHHRGARCGVKMGEKMVKVRESREQPFVTF